MSAHDSGVAPTGESQPVKVWRAEAERLITDLEWARMRHSNADPHRGERIKAALLAHLGTYPTEGVDLPDGAQQ